MITLHLPGRVVPKARPRGGGGNFYLPSNYRDWKDSAIVENLAQYRGPQIAKAKILIELHGSHRGDADNLSGSCLDALVQSGVLTDDRLSCVPEIHCIHHPGKQTYAQVRLLPL